MRIQKDRDSVHVAQVSQLSQQTAFAKHQPWPVVKPVLLAALICAAPVRASSAQDAKVSVDMMGIGSMSCAHWQSTQAHRLEGTIWIYGFWTGLNYVASASEQTETKVDTAAVVFEVKKTCAQRPSQVLASAVWAAYLDLNKR
jgi:redox-regulated HSP33 family molecular chaperone